MKWRVMMKARRKLIAGSVLLLLGGWFGLDYLGPALELIAPEGDLAQPVRERPAASKQNGAGGHAAEAPAKSVNPLASLSLDALKQTVERPLFNASRQPKPKPEPVVAAVADEEKTGPEDFTLMAIVVTPKDKTALLRVNKTSEIVRLKPGETFAEWTLTDIKPKAVVIANEDESFPLELFSKPAQPAVAGDSAPPPEPESEDSQSVAAQAVSGDNQ